DLRPLGATLGHVLADPLDGVGQIALGGDVVAGEHAPGAPAPQLHRYLLGDAAADGVPGRAPAEVVRDDAREAGRLARRPPRLAEVDERCVGRASPASCVDPAAVSAAPPRAP